MILFFIYLLVDTKTVNGRLRKYVGLTTDGPWRFDSHMQGWDGVVATKWINEIKGRGDVPHHLVLDTAESLWELQIKEMAYIQILRLMGETLVNTTDGGEPGTSRKSNPDPRLQRLPDSEVAKFCHWLRTIIVPPTERVREEYDLLTELQTSFGGFVASIELLKIKRAKQALFGPPKEVSKPHLNIVRPVESSKWKCSVVGCEATKHHGKGLCHKHHDAKRRPHKKKANVESKGALHEQEELPSLLPQLHGA